MSLSRLEAYAAQVPSFADHVKKSLGKVGLSPAEQLRAAEHGNERHAGGGLENVTSPEIRERIETSYELTGKMAREYLGLDEIPTPEDMAASGVDHVWLADEYKRMEIEGLQPRFILAPYGLGLGNTDSGHGWRRGFSKARQDTSIPNNPLKQQYDGDGLWINNDAAANWHVFDKAPEITTTPGAATLPIYETTTPDGVTVQWTLRLIPGTPKPQHLNVSYEEATAQGVTHQAVPEMLTDKLTAIIQGGEPSDKNTWAWCDNGDPAGARAPFGYWRRGSGRVCVNWREVGFRHDLLGSRSPVG
jgi:hypothetical protein